MDLNQLWVLLWTVIGTIVTGLATWFTAFIVGLINEKIKDKKIARWSSELFQIIMTSVQCIQQTFVDAMKKAGKWDAAAAEEAKNKCLSIITNQLTPELIKYIEDNFGDMKEYLMNQIEAMIYQLKLKK